MRKIKVKAIFGAHQIYQEIANYPPENVEYIGVSKDTSKGEYYQNKKWKERINEFAQKFKIPRIIFIGNGDFDLIHSSRGIIPIQLFSNKPWVMDIEYFSSFMGLDTPLLLKNKRLRKFIEKRLSSKNCKKILCHCEATKNSMLKYLDCSKFINKLDVLYPSSHLIKEKKEIHKNIRFLAVLSLFNQKGGKEILEAFSHLEKKYNNIELWIKSDVPSDLKEKYQSKNIKMFKYFQDIIPREELIKNFYLKTDALIYPTFCDSFGFSLIDGLSVGIPIITTNIFASPEIIKNKINGYIIKIPKYKREEWIQDYNRKYFDEKDRTKFISDLEKAMGLLIKNKNNREKMGNTNFKLISEGKFSIKERNKKLKKVYEEALK